MISLMEKRAAELRGTLLEMSHRVRAAHLGSALSCVDLLIALYFHAMDKDDRFILSKGHGVAALYGTLAQKGMMDPEDLFTFTQPGSALEEHPGPGTLPGIEAATGSLGHGLSLGAGMALSRRLKEETGRCFVLMGDGECNEGSVWEAAMFAGGQKLDRLCAIVDFNKWQATGRSCDTMALEPLAAKFQAFGWESREVDGHNMEALASTLDQLPFGDGKPLALIAHTVKGKGVSFMEDDNNWHYRIPTREEVLAGKRELGLGQ
ncbi:MAG: transketolase [Desulfobacterales bacterium]|nr:transketolase [Desulfobacterales bacterium]